MVSPDAAIIMCDIAIKNLERGAVPIVVDALKDFMRQCEKEKERQDGKHKIQQLNSQQYQEPLKSVILKLNEIISDRNERFA